ncbi:hypothetical protein GOODEAATRI_016614 [Goodea atripinnis]|uniref:Uncharacterized protein n=1 Tax=Goodea atripinnis TaxID=208336 RepID=A0ABV0NP91_9TELE
MENNCPESRLNIPQLVRLKGGTVIVKTFDWQAHLSPSFRKLPQIKSYQPFSFDANRPDVVLGLTETQCLLAFSCCVNRKFYPLLPVFLPCMHLDWPWTGRLIFIQRSDLFCSNEAKDMTYPAPKSTTQKNTQKRMMV